LTVNVDLHPQPRTELLTENQDYSSSNVKTVKTKINTPQTNGKKRRKQPRKRTQSKQRSVINESADTEDQIDDISEDEYEDENAEIY
jgi:hypothetical protein